MPVVLIGREFWDPLVGWLRETMLEKHRNIWPHDLNLFTITDSVDEALRIIVQRFEANRALALEPGTDEELRLAAEQRLTAEGTRYGVAPAAPPRDHGTD